MKTAGRFRIKSRICRAAFVLAAVVAVCVGMNMLAPLIDTQAMREHAAEGVDMIYGQGATPQLVGGFKSAQLDNYTSALMVKTAAYTGQEELVRRMFGGYRVDTVDEEGGQDWGTFCTYVPGGVNLGGHQELLPLLAWLYAVPAIGALRDELSQYPNGLALCADGIDGGCAAAYG